MGKQLKITPPEDAGTSLHFHHDQVNAHEDHKHELEQPGESFACNECGDMIRKAQKANPDNFVGWKIEKA